jgi:hypothetical protein
MDFFLVVRLVGEVVFFVGNVAVIMLLLVVVGLITGKVAVVDLTVVDGITEDEVEGEVGNEVVFLLLLDTDVVADDDSSESVDGDLGFPVDGCNGK